MATKKTTTVEEYLATVPKEAKAHFKQLRATVKKAVPKAEERLSYGIVGLKLNGMVIYYAGWKSHVSLYPIPKGDEAFQKQIAPHKTGKGTLQFPLDKPLPLALITKVAKLRAREDEERALAKKKK